MPALLTPNSASQMRMLMKHSSSGDDTCNGDHHLHAEPESNMLASKLRDRMDALVAIDNQLEQCHASRSVTVEEVEETIEWLQARIEPPVRHNSVSGVAHAVLQWARSRIDSNPDTLEPATSLPLAWGSTSLGFTWEQMNFGVLNAPLYVDMLHARRLVLSGSLLHATPMDRAEFVKWFEEFLDHVRLCDALKQRLLQIKARLTNKTIRVLADYTHVQARYEESVWIMQSGAVPVAFDDKILACLAEVEHVLRDEENAVAEANLLVVNPTLEMEALSSLLRSIDGDADEATFVAKLIAWMHHAVAADDFAAAFALLAPEAQRSLATDWMQDLVDHVHRLQVFDVEFHYSVVNERARADIVVPHVAPRAS
ncbi:Aste57867_19788 [Aphanomyces stellatus]|uniref:Aste57867_19788 protein n=1 Tax=Aphanomyces stellatus TaxID=120398 RepID=A0A485LDF2_9STRA|nr:hypothetical protein As57867_019723 [Aphanomyces stellatus]VFT96486.1 Aste57867_19788 [Aphanomyces stellatus]